MLLQMELNGTLGVLHKSIPMQGFPTVPSLNVQITLVLHDWSVGHLNRLQGSLESKSINSKMLATHLCYT